MAFHGGLLGVIIAMYFYSRSQGKGFFAAADLVAPVVPIGLGMGRLGNFINGELWGKVSEVPWAMVFPGAEPLGAGRHPSQLLSIFIGRCVVIHHPLVLLSETQACHECLRIIPAGLWCLSIFGRVRA